MRKMTSILLAAMMLLTAVIPASASVRGGDREFERAWRIFSARQADRATDYFKGAAEQYGEAMREDPMSRTMRFQSTLIKAGISSYYAGDFDQSIKAMQLAVRKDERIWESDLYTALSYARKGDRENAMLFIGKFMDSMSSQRFITDAVLRQMPGMKAGTISLEDGFADIDRATKAQFVDNILRNSNRRTMQVPGEECSGAFWWRKNAAPCSQGYPWNRN